MKQKNEQKLIHMTTFMMDNWIHFFHSSCYLHGYVIEYIWNVCSFSCFI